MKRFIVFLASLIALLVFGATFVFSFTEYSKEREEKIVKNLSTFMVYSHEGKSIINIPESDYSLITLKTKEGRRFISSNMNLPFDSTLYRSLKSSAGETSAIVYYKKFSLSEYIMFIVSKPAYAGMLFASAFLFIALMVYISGETGTQQRQTGMDEKLLDKLKALRLTLSTMKIIPEDSAQEMKRVLDSILKESK
jgi:hypothetical protein